MRRPTVLLTFVIVVSACGGGEATTAPSTSDTVITSVATQPTTATLGTTTTQAQDPTSTTITPIVGGVATRLDGGCSYEGHTEFDLNSQVTFSFVNATEVSDKGFTVWKIPEGTTVEDITEARRMPSLVDFEEGFYDPYLPTGQGRGPGSVSKVSVVLDRPGLHALICFQLIDEDENLGQDYAASLITVNG